jgi:hypothetical protein
VILNLLRHYSIEEIGNRGGKDENTVPDIKAIKPIKPINSPGPDFEAKLATLIEGAAKP